MTVDKTCSHRSTQNGVFKQGDSNSLQTMDDLANWKAVQHSLDVLDFSPEEQTVRFILLLSSYGWYNLLDTKCIHNLIIYKIKWTIHVNTDIYISIVFIRILNEFNFLIWIRSEGILQYCRLQTDYLFLIFFIKFVYSPVVYPRYIEIYVSFIVGHSKMKWNSSSIV